MAVVAVIANRLRGCWQSAGGVRYGWAAARDRPTFCTRRWAWAPCRANHPAVRRTGGGGIVWRAQLGPCAATAIDRHSDSACLIAGMGAGRRLAAERAYDRSRHAMRPVLRRIAGAGSRLATLGMKPGDSGFVWRVQRRSAWSDLRARGFRPRAHRARAGRCPAIPNRHGA
jgi:hypothetical protein